MLKDFLSWFENIFISIFYNGILMRKKLNATPLQFLLIIYLLYYFYCLEQIQRKGSKILPPGTRLCKQCSISLQSLIKVSFPEDLDPLLWKYYIKNDRSERHEFCP